MYLYIFAVDLTVLKQFLQLLLLCEQMIVPVTEILNVLMSP